MYPILALPRRIKLQPDFSTLYVQTSRVQVNESAAAILALCDGKNSIQEIIGRLITKYQEKEEVVSGFVNEFLEQSVRIGTVQMLPDPAPMGIELLGSMEYWSPELVVVELTHRCMLACKHCFLRAGKGEDIDRGLLDQLCEEIAETGVDLLQLTGGEPFLYPRIEEVISFFENTKVVLSITTSGMFPARDLIGILEPIKANRGWVQVSLDGLEETHNRLRNHPESYSRAVHMIRELTGKGICVHVATCVTTESLDEMEMLCQQVKDWGVSCHRIGVASERGRAVENGINSPLEFRNRVQAVRNNLRTRYANPTFIISGLEDDLVSIRKGINCGAGYRTIKVSPDGRLHPCPILQCPVADLHQETFKDFILKKSAVFANIHSPNEEICGACSSNSLCKGCMAEAFIYRERQACCSWSQSQKINKVFADLYPS